MSGQDNGEKQGGEAGDRAMEQHAAERDVDADRLIDEAQRSAQEHEEKRRSGKEQP